MEEKQKSWIIFIYIWKVLKNNSNTSLNSEYDKNLLFKILSAFWNNVCDLHTFASFYSTGEVFCKGFHVFCVNHKPNIKLFVTFA